ncbi:MAG: 16S rRNA (uracil(1498)-N(3))-methyltransferase [Armatimonadetes bacterium]|nr:16S rRNA (uracil(1498)-N(3))-methyltransferase [Armatimonadota bacterium]
MARITVSPAAFSTDPVPGFRLEGADLKHSRVLRVGVGDVILIVDGSGLEFTCEIAEVTTRSLFARVVSKRPLADEARLSVHLYCALLKGEKLDWVLQKACEIGVARIALFESERTVARGEKKERWGRIVASAAAQCGRAGVPEVDGPLSFSEVLADAVAGGVACMLWEGEGTRRLSEVVPRQGRMSLIVGPEGGFSEAEALLARAAGVRTVTLGSRILRAETAAIVAPALALACSGDLG